ncbi:MAG: tRNA pseudouridine(55) synthase TruB [Erysipelotrichaceae bacterium]|nr:tRNA pseudouridine(55) synthase TruB [Erysipelotrichaceae bacterium]
MENVLYVDKPKGISSFDVCYKLRRVLGTKKIGHTGTLDPNATGVMIVLFDKATKANQFLVSDSKEYLAEVKIGIETDTLDIGGNIIGTYNESMPEETALKQALNAFLGESMQEVPITSAVSVDGKRLYRYQRENKEVKLPQRKITVHEIELIEYKEDSFVFRASVSSGTYIRALARDILKKLGIHGTLTELRRTKVDTVDVNDCDPLERILNGDYSTHDLYDLLASRYEVVEDFDEKDVRNGKRIEINGKKDQILMAKDHQALAIYERDGDAYKCVRGLW